MEEDIKIIEEMIKNYKIELEVSEKYTIDGFKPKILKGRIQALESLLKAYKQDEKMIDLMADYIHLYTLSGEEDVYCFKVNDCEVVGGSKSCFDCIKEHFRKKVEDERN